MHRFFLRPIKPNHSHTLLPLPHLCHRKYLRLRHMPRLLDQLLRSLFFIALSRWSAAPKPLPHTCFLDSQWVEAVLKLRLPHCQQGCQGDPVKRVGTMTVKTLIRYQHKLCCLLFRFLGCSWFFTCVTSKTKLLLIYFSFST